MLTALKEKILSALRQSAVHQTSLELADDDEELHLDLGRADQLASYCRTKLNRVTARTLYTATMEMRRRDTCCYISTAYLLHIYYISTSTIPRLDYSRDSVLAPAAVDAVLVSGLGVPLGPAMEQLHARFRDKRSVA